MSKDQFITIRVSTEEKKMLKELAQENNMTISKYILHTAREKASAKNFIKYKDQNYRQLSFFDARKTRFCRICGNELTVDSGYCSCCGAKTE